MRVGLQDLVDDQEKLVQPPLGQGPHDCAVALSGAELLVLDVGMSDVRAPCGRIGVEGHDAIRQLFFRGAGPPIESNLKSPQLDPFQDDGLGRDKQFMVF